MSLFATDFLEKSDILAWLALGYTDELFTTQKGEAPQQWHVNLFDPQRRTQPKTISGDGLDPKECLDLCKNVIRVLVDRYIVEIANTCKLGFNITKMTTRACLSRCDVQNELKTKNAEERNAFLFFVFYYVRLQLYPQVMKLKYYDILERVVCHVLNVKLIGTLQKRHKNCIATTIAVVFNEIRFKFQDMCQPPEVRMSVEKGPIAGQNKDQKWRRTKYEYFVHYRQRDLLSKKFKIQDTMEVKIFFAVWLIVGKSLTFLSRSTFVCRKNTLRNGLI